MRGPYEEDKPLLILGKKRLWELVLIIRIQNKKTKMKKRTERDINFCTDDGGLTEKSFL